MSNLGKIMETKDKVVDGLTGGIEHLFKKYKVEYLKGHGSFIDNHALNVKQTAGGDKIVSFENAIIATGSQSNDLPDGLLPVDEKLVVSSTGR